MALLSQRLISACVSHALALRHLLHGTRRRGEPIRLPISCATPFEMDANLSPGVFLFGSAPADVAQ
jgi:hypothetical protein